MGDDPVDSPKTHFSALEFFSLIKAAISAATILEACSGELKRRCAVFQTVAPQEFLEPDKKCHLFS